jgi:hypothetical protein
MEVTRIAVDEARTRQRSLAMVDARSADAWCSAKSRVPGAIRVPPEDVSAHISRCTGDRAIVRYCT